MIWNFILVFAVLVLLRFILNAYKLYQVRRYFKLYLDYTSNPTFAFEQHAPQIIELFKDAKIADFSIPRLEPAGYGQLRKYSLSGFLNITLLDSDIVTPIQGTFHKAIGVFRHKMLQSINPLFWIEFIFKLPQYIFEFVGVLPDKIIVKVALIIYWLLAIGLGLKKFDLLKELLK